MDTTETQVQIFSLSDLLSSTLVATVDADTAAAQRYFNNMCKVAFEEYDPLTNEAGNFRTLAFKYTGQDGTIQSLNIPILSLIPLPLLQVKDAEFGFNVRVLDMLVFEEEETFSLEDEADANEAYSNETMEIPPQLRVALLPYKQTSEDANDCMPNMKVNIRLQQADVPGGLARFLQVINNLNFKPAINNKSENDTE